MKKLVLLTLVVTTLLLLASCSDNPENSVFSYYGAPFEYEDLEITIVSVEEDNEDPDEILTTITFSAKNIGENESDFSLTDIYLKSIETNEKYKCKTSIIGTLFQASVGPGESHEYTIKFELPKSLSEEKYIMYFDFGYPSARLALYYESGEMIEVYNPKTAQLERVKKLQSDMYDLIKKYAYDKIDGSLSYSDVQYLMDTIKYKLRQQTSEIDIYLDLSEGIWYPKWICYVILEDGSKCPLVYMNIELSSSYTPKHKHIGTYEINELPIS